MTKRGSPAKAAGKKSSSEAAASEGDDRLSRLRKEMVCSPLCGFVAPGTHLRRSCARHARSSQEDAGVHAVIVPSEDPHQSEYAAACYERRQFISRFTVSCGL